MCQELKHLWQLLSLVPTVMQRDLEESLLAWLIQKQCGIGCHLRAHPGPEKRLLSIVSFLGVIKDASQDNGRFLRVSSVGLEKQHS